MIFYFRKKSGFASISIVLMTVVIITLGLSIVALAQTDKKLATKKNDWTTRYYNLEGEIMEDIALIDEYFKINSPNELDGNTLVSKMGEMGYDIASSLRVDSLKPSIKLEVLLIEEDFENPMVMTALIEKNGSEHFIIRELIQSQEEGEYESFY